MDKTLKKWLPVIETILHGESKTDEFKQFMAYYAEHHQESLAKKVLSTEPNFNWLPVSLKVLNKLNLKDVKLNINDKNYKTTKISIKSEGDFKSVEDSLIETFIVNINKELEGKKQLDIHLLISEITMERIDDKYAKFTLYSLYNIS